MQENKDKISIDNTQGKFLLFFPKTTGEAEELVNKLRDAGFTVRAKSSTPLTPDKIIESGIGVLNGEFFCGPNKDWNGAPLGNWLCKTEQIDSDYLPPVQRMMLDLFNQMSARIDALAEKIDRIEQQVCPQEIEKPATAQRKGLKGSDHAPKQ